MTSLFNFQIALLYVMVLKSLREFGQVIQHLILTNQEDFFEVMIRYVLAFFYPLRTDLTWIKNIQTYLKCNHVKLEITSWFL